MDVDQCYGKPILPLSFLYSNKLECTIGNAQILEHSTHVQLIRFNEILDTQILNRREVVDVLKEPLNCVYQPS